MNETMTVRQVLEITMRNLGNIAVPRALNEMIGIPIDQAISNLQACIDALERDETSQTQEEEAQDKPELNDEEPKTEDAE